MVPNYRQVWFRPTRGEAIHRNLAGQAVRLVEVNG